MTEKKALFRFNDFQCKDICEFSFGNRGYSVKVTESIEEMLEEAKIVDYDWYLIDDFNPKQPKNLDLTHAHRVYEIIKRRVERGEAKFLVLSYFQEVINKAKQEGLSVMDKGDFDGQINKIVGNRVY